MQDVLHPHHQHAHRVWLVPDSTLGRWSAFVFAVSATVAVAAPVVAWVTYQLTQPGAGTPWFFAAWGSALVALAVALGSAVVAAVALFRDHAVLLLVPVALGVLAVSAFVTTNGVLN
jgi:uncharacterized membrane protein required for colicin V production